MEFTKEELENEVWVDIVGYENKYRISDLGRVLSLSYRGTKKEKLLSLVPNKSGYIIVQFSKDKKLKPHYVHRLVANHFIFNPLNKAEVNHIDEYKNNNRKVNLEWNTRVENLHHSLKDKTSRYIGVCTDKRRKNKWRAIISIKRKNKSLGSFSTELEAGICRTKYEVDNNLLISNPSLLQFI